MNREELLDWVDHEFDFDEPCRAVPQIQEAIWQAFLLGGETERMAASARTIAALDGHAKTIEAQRQRIAELEAQLSAPPSQGVAEPVAIELSGIQEQMKDGAGFWHSCSGCYETEDGHPVGNYAYSTVMACPLGNGCSECGGIGAVWDNTDYEEMARDWDKEEAPQPAGTDKLRDSLDADSMHSAIMNMPCKRTMSHFSTRADWLLYAEGHRDARHAAAELAASAAGQAPVREVPEGMKLLPIVATDTMRRAGEEAYESYGNCDCGNAHGTSMDYVYEAMIAAAPVQQEGM